MRLTVKGQRADTEVNGSLLPAYGMQTREKALEKNREEKDSNLYMPFLPTSYGFGAIGNRTEWRETQGLIRSKFRSRSRRPLRDLSTTDQRIHAEYL